jgi:hypothetical protein
MDRAARAGLKRQAKEIEAEMKAKERKADELDHAHAFVERLQGVGVGDLDEETVETLKDLPRSSLDALYTLARLQRPA